MVASVFLEDGDPGKWRVAKNISHLTDIFCADNGSVAANSVSNVSRIVFLLILLLYATGGSAV